MGPNGGAGVYGLSKKSAKSKNRMYIVQCGGGGGHNTVYLDDGLKIL